MNTLDFQEIAKLINYSRSTQIAATPLTGTSGKWALHQGYHKVRTSTYPFFVVYLNSAATLTDIKAAVRSVKDHEQTELVYASSLEKTIKNHPEIAQLAKPFKAVFGIKDYLLSFIKDELQAYLEKLRSQAPKFYVDPKVTTPSGISLKSPNPLLSFMRDPDTASGAFGGKLAILLAEPGQGKTYMSRYLVSALSGLGAVTLPLMVDSSQWHTLPLEDQLSMPKTIIHSFRHFGATISWLEGHEEEFLKATLKADIFRIVFDGFDEYVLRNGGVVTPLEVLETLAELADSTGARIVITSRTSFWNSNLPGAEVEAFIKRTGSLLYEIVPFDLNQANRYFVDRLKTKQQVNTASDIFGKLSKRDPSLVGRGFVLSLIADLAERSASSATPGVGEQNELLWLTKALCEREVLRQDLPFTCGNQILLLETLSTESAWGEQLTTDLFRTAMRLVRPDFDDETLQGALEKFRSHPLLERDKKTGVWNFKQEQVEVLLLADQIVRWDEAAVAKFTSRAKLDGSRRQDVANTIVDLLISRESEESAREKIESICRTLSRGTGESGRLAAVLALNAVDRILPSGSTHLDRRLLLLRIGGGGPIRNFDFTGTIARYDLRGVKFDHCRFDSVAWANCKFDTQTVFSSCQFAGGVPPEYCEGFGSVLLDDCQLDPEAGAIFNSAKIKEGRKRYSSEDLSNDIRSVVNKFIIKGLSGLRSVSELNLNKGSISASRHRDEILNELLLTVLERHVISGGFAGYNVRADAVEAVKFYAANNVLTGALRNALDSLAVRLGLV